MAVAFFVQQLLPTCSARLCLQHICLFCAAIVSHLQCSPMSAAQLPLLCSNCFTSAVLACVCSIVAFCVQQVLPICSPCGCQQHNCLSSESAAYHLLQVAFHLHQLPIICSKLPFACRAEMGPLVRVALSVGQSHWGTDICLHPVWGKLPGQPSQI